MSWTAFPDASEIPATDWRTPLHELRDAASERIDIKSPVVGGDPTVADYPADPDDPNFTPQDRNFYALAISMGGVYFRSVDFTVGTYEGEPTILRGSIPVILKGEIRISKTFEYFGNPGVFRAAVIAPGHAPVDFGVGTRAKDFTTGRTYRAIQPPYGIGIAWTADYDTDPDLFDYNFENANIAFEPFLLNNDLLNAVYKRINETRWFLGNLWVRKRSKEGFGGDPGVKRGDNFGYLDEDDVYRGFDDVAELVSYAKAYLPGANWTELNSVGFRTGNFGDASPGFELGGQVLSYQQLSTDNSDYPKILTAALRVDQVKVATYTDHFPALSFGSWAFEADLMAAVTERVSSFGVNSTGGVPIKVQYDAGSSDIPAPIANRWRIADTYTAESYESDWIGADDIPSANALPKDDPDGAQWDSHGFGIPQLIPIYRFDVPGGFNFVD